MGLSDVCFADDLLLFAREDTSSVQELMAILDKFVDASGLRANQLKSCIYFGGVNESTKQDMLRITGMTEGKLPFKYLGVPLSTQRLNVMQCQVLVHKLLLRISGWAVKLLSYAGRVQLIKSVLFGIQMYWSQVLVLPQKVVKMIQAACRIFLWTCKVETLRRASVAWDKVMMPLIAGGLNILNLKHWNRAAICKMLWNLAQKKDKIWVKWVRGYYIKSQDVYEMKVPVQSSWIIRKIIGVREHLKKLPHG